MVPLTSSKKKQNIQNKKNLFNFEKIIAKNITSKKRKRNRVCNKKIKINKIQVKFD